MPFSAPTCSSKRENASATDVVTTPPKSKIAASNMCVEYASRGREPYDAFDAEPGRLP